MFGVDAKLLQVKRGHEVILESALVEWLEDHANGRGVVRDRVDEDEGTRLVVLGVGIEEERLSREDVHLSDFIQLEGLTLFFL